MKTPYPMLAIALAALLVLAPAAVADDTETPESRLIETKAGAIVSVKFVLQISFNFQGQQGDQEQNGQVVGIMIDPAGLVMVPSLAFDVFPRRGGRRGGGGNVKTKPTNIRIVFPGDEKEYPAILGAKDSKFGLAFLLIKELGEKKVTSLDLSNVAEPKIGDTLYGVTRLDQGFDYAPVCDSVKVVGKVEKPRPMWALSGANRFVAEPLYAADGAVVGVCAVQDGVGEESSSGAFLLPLEIIRPTVVRAKKESERALEETLEAEAEAAKEAAEDEGGKDDGGKDDGGKDDGDGGGDGGEDGGK